jgi:ATP synthase protein I
MRKHEPRAPDLTGSLSGGPTGGCYTSGPMAGEPSRGGPSGGEGMAWSIIGTLLAGVLVWGGIGYLLDRWTGAHGVFAAIGAVIGAAGAFYLVYVRYGKS